MKDTPIEVDLGPYASKIYKFQLFSEHYMSDNKALKFLHFNNDKDNKSLSRKQAKANKSRTVAILSLSPHSIVKNAVAYSGLGFGDTLFMQMAIGVEKVSLDDTYVKSIGRDKSVSKMQEVDLEVIGVNVNPTHIMLHFAEYEGINLTARLNRATGFSTIIGKMNGPVNKTK